MRVLIACEFSGRVRDAFARNGHDAWSCDLDDTESPGNHIKGDVRDWLRAGYWDLMVAFPPCTYLTRAAAQLRPLRQPQMHAAHLFVRELYDAPIPRVAIENPHGALNKLWRYPDQVIQPWYFGEPKSKAACLWLKNLPPLMATYVHTTREHWVANKVGHRDRSKHRSRTFPAVAQAMADQWGPR
jgi:hypothetical protein